MIKHLYKKQFNITLLFQKYKRVIWKQNNTPLTIINKDIKEGEKWNTLPESSFESLYNLKTLLEKIYFFIRNVAEDNYIQNRPQQQKKLAAQWMSNHQQKFCFMRQLSHEKLLF